MSYSRDQNGRAHLAIVLGSYVQDLAGVLDMKAIASSGLRIGVDPLGGASLPMWEPIAEAYGIDLEVVNRAVDPTFRFVPCDKDGKIRMDCSSPYAMSRLLDLRDHFDLSYVFISHNLSVVGIMSDRVAVMYLGRMVETAPTDTLFERAAHPYTQALLAAAPSLKPGQRTQRSGKRGGSYRVHPAPG